MSYPTCFWTLLSQKELNFVFLSSSLSEALGSECNSLLGTSFFDYFHPQEQELARRDLLNFVKKRTLYGSVTRCQYNSIPAIRQKLTSKFSQKSFQNIKFTMYQQQQQPSRTETITTTNTITTSSPSNTTTEQNSRYTFVHSNPEINQQGSLLSAAAAAAAIDDQEYVIMDVGINVVSQGFVLACFHTSDARSSTSLSTGSCGESAITQEQLSKLSSLFYQHSAKFQSPPSPTLFGSPDRIFQIFDKETRNLLFSWSDPTLTRHNHHKDDFSKFLHEAAFNSDASSSSSPSSRSPSNDGFPNCIQPYDKKHMLPLGSGIYRTVESVTIPHGRITFGCFQISPSTEPFDGNFAKGKRPHSAPCSPATSATNYNIGAKRLRSPGSFSPPTSFNSNNCFADADFDLELSSRFTKKRATVQDSPPMSPPHIQNHQEQAQHSFPPIEQFKERQQVSRVPQYHQEHQQHYHLHNSNNNNQQQKQSQPQPSNNFSSSSSSSSSPSSHTNSSSSPSNPVPVKSNAYAGRGRTSSSVSGGIKVCESCHTDSSPEWRRGPTGHKTLCNACGLRYSRTIARENRKREQAQREREQREREARERDERAQERAMQRHVEPFQPFPRHAHSFQFSSPKFSSQMRPDVPSNVELPPPTQQPSSVPLLPPPSSFLARCNDSDFRDVNNSERIDRSNHIGNDDQYAAATAAAMTMTMMNNISSNPYSKEAYFGHAQ